MRYRSSRFEYHLARSHLVVSGWSSDRRSRFEDHRAKSHLAGSGWMNHRRSRFEGWGMCIHPMCHRRSRWKSSFQGNQGGCANIGPVDCKPSVRGWNSGDETPGSIQIYWHAASGPLMPCCRHPMIQSRRRHGGWTTDPGCYGCNRKTRRVQQMQHGHLGGGWTLLYVWPFLLSWISSKNTWHARDMSVMSSTSLQGERLRNVNGNLAGWFEASEHESRFGPSSNFYGKCHTYVWYIYTHRKYFIS